MFRSMPQRLLEIQDLWSSADWWHFGQFMFLPRCHKQLLGTHGNQCDSGEGHHIGSDQKFQSRRDLESMGPHGILSGNCASGSKHQRYPKVAKQKTMENPCQTKHQIPVSLPSTLWIIGLYIRPITGLHLLKRRRCAENLPKASRAVGMVQDVQLMDLHQCWKIETLNFHIIPLPWKTEWAVFFV